MTVSGPAAIAERVAASSARGLGARILLIIIAKRGRVGFRGCHSVFSQVASGELHEDVFEAGLARAQVFELMPVVGYRIQKSGDSQVRLPGHSEGGWSPHAGGARPGRAAVTTDGLYAGQRSPAIDSVVVVIVVVVGASVVVLIGVAYLELDHVMAAQAVDEVRGSAFGYDLAVIDYGELVAEAFGLVHVVRGEQDGATFFLESADDVPELAAALGIESGGGLVEK